MRLLEKVKHLSCDRDLCRWTAHRHYGRSDTSRSQYAYERKEAIQKTIMAMTLGKDVSQLFPDVLKNIATGDLDQKKLVYLYLMYERCTSRLMYADKEQELRQITPRPLHSRCQYFRSGL